MKSTVPTRTSLPRRSVKPGQACAAFYTTIYINNPYLHLFLAPSFFLEASQSLRRVFRPQYKIFKIPQPLSPNLLKSRPAGACTDSTIPIPHVHPAAYPSVWTFSASQASTGVTVFNSRRKALFGSLEPLKNI